MTMPFAVIHRDTRLWGDDAGEFNPMRFENGTRMAAKHPNAMLVFYGAKDMYRSGLRNVGSQDGPCHDPPKVLLRPCTRISRLW